MATISKEQMTVEGVSFLRIIKCDARGLFTINLPPHFKEKLGRDHVTGESKDGALSEFRKAIEEFQKLHSVKRKVICYNVNTNIFIPSVLQSDDNDFAGETPLMIGIGVGVYEEETIETDKVLRKIYREVESTIPEHITPKSWDRCERHENKQKGYASYLRGGRGFKILPWSQEVEDFFVKIAESLTSAIMQCEKMKKPEQLKELAARAAGFQIMDKAQEE